MPRRPRSGEANGGAGERPRSGSVGASRPIVRTRPEGGAVAATTIAPASRPSDTVGTDERRAPTRCATSAGAAPERGQARSKAAWIASVRPLPGVEQHADLRPEVAASMVTMPSQLTTLGPSKPFACPTATSLDKPRILVVIGATVTQVRWAAQPRASTRRPARLVQPGYVDGPHALVKVRPRKPRGVPRETVHVRIALPRG